MQVEPMDVQRFEKRLAVITASMQKNAEGRADDARHLLELRAREHRDDQQLRALRDERVVEEHARAAHAQLALPLRRTRRHEHRRRRQAGVEQSVSDDAADDAAADDADGELGRNRHRRPPSRLSRARRPERQHAAAAARDEDVPLTESIADCVSRVRPFWENELLPALLDGSRCLVVGHAGSR